MLGLEGFIVVEVQASVHADLQIPVICNRPRPGKTQPLKTPAATKPLNPIPSQRETLDLRPSALITIPGALHAWCERDRRSNLFSFRGLGPATS